MSIISADVATRDKARQYKSELLASVFGVPAAALAPGVQLSGGVVAVCENVIVRDWSLPTVIL